MSDDTQKQSFGDLLKEYFSGLPKVGDMVEGDVISVDNGAVRIDVGGLTTGVVRGAELFAESREYSHIKPGDTVKATIIEQENEQGEMELSFRVAGHQRVWDLMQEHITSGVTIEAKVIRANKGGLMMMVDALSGFMPVSQLAPEHYPRVPGGDKNRILEHLRAFQGTTMQVKVIDANQKEEKLIVSEKAVWEDAQKSVLEQFNIGDVIEGEVSALTSFGAFVKFGPGLEGLVHISEIAWQRIDHPKDVLKIGEAVKAQIIDLNKSKIYLSIKRLVDDPWKSVKDKFSVGQKVEGEVHKIEPFGLMVRLDEHIHGLAHISEVSNTPMHTVDELREKFEIGKPYTFEIVNIEPAEHRLGLRLDGVKPKEKKEAPAKKEEFASAKATAGKEEKEAPSEEKTEEVTEEKA